MMDPQEKTDRREAQAAFEAGDLTTAANACKRLLSRNKKDVNVLQMMAEISRKSGLEQEALAYYEKCLKFHPTDAQAHFNTANLLLAMGNARGAMAKLGKALKLAPNYTAAKIEMAFVLERLGDYGAARKGISGLSVTGNLRSLLARIMCMIELREDNYAEAIRLAEPHIRDETAPIHTRRQLALLQGQAYDKLGDEDHAMESWKLAHEIGRYPFDLAEYCAQFDEVIEFFSESAIAEMPRATNDSELPIFIAGMPRSGTTLVEQILDAHPKIRGAGELKEMELIHAALPAHLRSSAVYPACLKEMTSKHADRLASLYLKTLSRYAKNVRKRVINKSLENYKLLGLISLLLPKARVIYCRRDPVDTCLSLFMSDMLPSKHAYTTDLRCLGIAYRQAERLMEHWRRVLDLPILEVQYEELVANPEQVSRQIVEFCAMDWNDQCLNFHTSGRMVMTLSYHQVSKQIYSSAIGRWKRYEAHLGPLLEALKEQP